MLAPTGAILMNTFGDKLLTKDEDGRDTMKRKAENLNIFKSNLKVGTN